MINTKNDKRDIRDVMKKFHHDIAINDLKILYKCNAKSKLTYNSLMYLDIIGGKNGKYTASDIAKILHIEKPSVTQKLNILEKAGYIYKKQSEEDKRIFYLYVKDNEDDQVEQEFKKSDYAAEKMLRKNFSDEDVSKFFDMIEFMGDVLLKQEV
ncbi:MarR family transcriptional regulator [Sedimentibacter sp. zth1]|uniref:MarR family transcriptional regulator n=1 Tax=Sedimentibacter sp. zth1 TaxID=2816908 RepID=UPI001A923DB6|nr:MarR family transcriptional regulator [Sedimentibacter sp. zth1]QSX06400.1 MarR family transcriptional regulator [Sedimentibacter sp. zth1]